MSNGASIDPDQFLDLTRQLPFTREEGLRAWEQAYAALERRLSELGMDAELFVVFGIQGGGKSSWVKSAVASADEHMIFFSGPLPSKAHRKRALVLAKRFGAKAIAVWIKTPLETALKRNALRTGLARVPEAIIHHVEESLEPPSLAEGFNRILVVERPNAVE